jgi:cephalosporin-C deacetylase
VKLNISTLLFIAAVNLTGLVSYAQQVTPAKPATNKTEQKEEEEEGEMFIDVKAGSKNSIFTTASPIDYKVKIRSTYKSKQEGKFSYLVTTDDGKKVYEQSLPLKIGRSGSQAVNVSIPAKSPGFYHLSVQLNLTAYDDTIRKVFGVSPEKITTQNFKPADFDAFWQRSKTILSGVAPQYKITPDSRRSTKEIKTYLVEMHSWGNAVIHGWLTIPVNRPKHLPVRYRVPGYLVAMTPSYTEDDFAVFQINVRGNGNSKNAIEARGQQYNLININDRDNYVYRAVYMDCLRGLDFICDKAKEFGLDTNRISIDGGSQGGALAVVVAGLDKRIKAVTTEVPLYSDFRDASRIARMMPPKGQTPVWLLNNFVETHKTFTYDRLYKLWDYYDPINFAPMVKVPVLMGIGLLDDLCPPSCSFAMYNQIASKSKELWISADKAHELDPIYYRFQYVWLRENLLLP